MPPRLNTNFFNSKKSSDKKTSSFVAEKTIYLPENMHAGVIIEINLLSMPLEDHSILYSEEEKLEFKFPSMLIHDSLSNDIISLFFRDM